MSSPLFPHLCRARRAQSSVGDSGLYRRLLWWLLLTLTAPASALAVDLEEAQFAALPGNRVEITLAFSGPVQAPQTFATESPSRIAMDFPGVSSKLDRKAVPIGVGAVHSLVAVEASDRTRVVVNLNQSVPYEVSSNGNKVTLRIDTQGQVATNLPAVAPTPPRRSAPPPPVAAPPPAPRYSGGSGPAIRDIDFRRGPGGEGRVIVKLPSSDTRVAVRQQGTHLFVDVYDSSLPERLFRRLEVTDFATPVTAVESRPKGRNVELDVETGAEYDYLAYQADDQFTLELRSLTPAEKEQQQKKKTVYEGDRLSLNFQDIEVRAVLQLLADFTNLNLVASDTVRGNITLRLKNVPWDQALDIILKTKGLSMRQTGNVIMIAPTQEVAAQEKLELESEKQVEELAPLRSEFIQVNYAKASELADLLKNDKNQLLTKDRGNVTVDPRTNTLLVQDTSAKLEDIRRIVARLDVPVRQVMIESRIVIANNDFARDLGVRFGVNGSTGSGPKLQPDGTYSKGGTQLLVGGTQTGTMNVANYQTGAFGINTSTGTPYNSSIEIPTGSGNEGLMVNLPAPTPSGSVQFLLGKVGSYLLQLELSAMQKEGRGEIVSSPRVITSDSKKATIKVGSEIPYQEASASGATTTAFKEAVLQLDVTPQITPDDRLIMDLVVRKDDPDYSQRVLGVPPLNTRSVQTSVLVDNGETVVLGGVYERTKSFQKQQVPWLGDLPVVGRLFKLEQRTDNNNELLIFVTPKILKGDVARN